MADPTIPEAAVDAVLAVYPMDRYPEITAACWGILEAAAPHIGAAYLRHAAAVIRDRYPTSIWPDPDGTETTPDRHGAAMARAVARQLEARAAQAVADSTDKENDRG